jgi:hypothetical protein
VNACIPDTLRAAGHLLEAGEEVLASQILTQFSQARMAEALADCQAMSVAAYARLRALNDLNMTHEPRMLNQLW